MSECLLFRDRQGRPFALGFSLLFWILNLTGWYMQDHAMVPWGITGTNLLLSLLLSLPTGELLLRLDRLIRRKTAEGTRLRLQQGTPSHQLRYWLLCAAAQFAACIPVFLAYYPGVFAYDVFIELTQTAGSYTTLHPLAHTLLLHFFYDWVAPRFGGPTAAMALYTLLQTAAFSMIYAWVHLQLYRLRMGKAFRVTVLVLTCLHPVFSVLTISITKDILFTAFFAAALASLVQWELMPELFDRRSERLFYILCLTGAALFRNNGVYTIVIMLAAALLMYRGRPFFRRFLLCTLAGLVLFFSVNTGLKAAVKAENGPRNEMLSIPYQQLAYTYTYEKDTLSPEQQSAIEDMIPHLPYFTVFSADEAKYLSKGEDDPGSLVSLWLNVLPGHLKSYIEAVMHTTMGYWYVFDRTNANIYPHAPEERYGFLQTATTPFLGVEHTSYLTPLESLYEWLFSYNEYQSNPVTFLLCSPALYAWCIILLLVLALRHRLTCMAVPLTLVLALILTLFAGPCVLIRYAFPYIACLPSLIALYCRTGMVQKVTL